MLLLLTTLAVLAADPIGPTCAGPGPDGTWLDAPRPTLSGTEQTRSVDDGFFRLHFTDEGEDAVGADLLDWAAAELAQVRADVSAAPWRELAGDDGTGGDEAIDAYFVQIDAFGYANAVTPRAGAGGASCFVRFDPGIQDLGETVARSIVRHELHHCVQYRYSIDSHAWLYEAGATFEQYRPAPQEGALGLLTNLLWTQRLGEPDRVLDSVGDRFEYAGFSWFKHLEESGVPPWQVWEALEVEPAWREGMDRALDGDLAGRFLEWSVWNQAACGRGDETSFGGYASMNAACTAPFETPREVFEPEGIRLPGLTPWTSRALFIERPAEAEPSTVPLVRCAVDEGVLGLALDAPDVSYDPGMVGSASAEQGFAQATLPQGPETGALLVVVSVGEVPVRGQCAVTWIAPPEPAGCGCASSAPGGGVLLWGLPFLTLLRRRRS